MSAGDIILTHSTFLTGKLIRFGQRLRWRGARRQYAYFNHAALVVAEPVHVFRRQLNDGQIMEALGHGVERNELSKYANTEYVVIRTNTNPVDTPEVLAFANSVLEAKTRYGYAEILSLGLTLAIPLPIQFGSPGTMICSGFVAQALTRAGVIWPVDPSYAMPADIAEWYRVQAS